MSQLSLVVTALALVFHAAVYCVDSGDNEEISICSNVICLNGGTLNLTGSAVSCVCPSQFSGARCQISSCQNGGSALQLANGKYICKCPEGFSGDNCEKAPDHCSCQPCKNGGVCTNTADSYTCKCPTGFGGTNCETVIVVDHCADKPCTNGGTCTSTGDSYTCKCPAGFSGTNCETAAKDCAQVKATGSASNPAPSGVYNVLIGNQPAQVYCEIRTDYAWTVIQRRVSGDVNFTRNWADYEKGFGDLNANYWIGNSALNLLTSGPKQILRVELTDWKDVTIYAEYNNFVVGTAAEKYALKSLGTYSGTAEDALAYHLGSKFTTVDQKNDPSPRNCVVEYKGGWWYNGCYNANLNGVYQPSGVLSGQGLVWYKSNYTGYSYKRTLMMIRAAA